MKPKSSFNKQTKKWKEPKGPDPLWWYTQKWPEIKYNPTKIRYKVHATLSTQTCDVLKTKLASYLDFAITSTAENLEQICLELLLTDDIITALDATLWIMMDVYFNIEIRTERGVYNEKEKEGFVKISGQGEIEFVKYIENWIPRGKVLSTTGEITKRVSLYDEIGDLKVLLFQILGLGTLKPCPEPQRVKKAKEALQINERLRA